MNTLPDWLIKATSLHNEGRVDAALDVVYDYLDDTLWDRASSPFKLDNLWPPGRTFEPRPEAATEINQLLSDPLTLELPTDILLALITVTRSASKWLPNRRTFALKARDVFNQRDHNGDELVKNLGV